VHAWDQAVKLTFNVFYSTFTNAYLKFLPRFSTFLAFYYRAMYYIVQSAVLWLHVVRPSVRRSVCLSVCLSVWDIGWSGPHRLEILETNCMVN